MVTWGSKTRHFWLLWAPGDTFWRSQGPCWELRGKPTPKWRFARRKTSPKWRSKWTLFQCFGDLFLMCFARALFSGFLWFSVPRGSILATILASFWEPLTFEKTAKTVILSAFLEVWPLPIRGFLWPLIASVPWQRLFADFNDFRLIWELHLDDFEHWELTKRDPKRRCKKVC